MQDNKEDFESAEAFSAAAKELGASEEKIAEAIKAAGSLPISDGELEGVSGGLSGNPSFNGLRPGDFMNEFNLKTKKESIAYLRDVLSRKRCPECGTPYWDVYANDDDGFNRNLMTDANGNILSLRIKCPNSVCTVTYFLQVK